MKLKFWPKTRAASAPWNQNLGKEYGKNIFWSKMQGHVSCQKTCHLMNTTLARHTYEWVTSRVGWSHVTHLNVRAIHVMHVKRLWACNKLGERKMENAANKTNHLIRTGRYTNEWVTSHISMRYTMHTKGAVVDGKCPQCVIEMSRTECVIEMSRSGVLRDCERAMVLEKHKRHCDWWKMSRTQCIIVMDWNYKGLCACYGFGKGHKFKGKDKSFMRRDTWNLDAVSRGSLSAN